MYRAEQITDAVLFGVTLLSFLYGTVTILSQKKGAFYTKMIALGMGCLMLGQLHRIVTRLVGFPAEGLFSLETLGTVGCFLFFLTANYAHLDGIIDDGNPAQKRYRLLALAAPGAVLGLTVPVLFLPLPGKTLAACFLLAGIVMLEAYFNLKHLIFPDVEFGIAQSIRGYNLAALGLCICTVTANTGLLWESVFLTVLGRAGAAVCILAILPVLNWGVKKWTR